MRENRPYGSEGGEGSALPYPYRGSELRLLRLLQKCVQQRVELFRLLQIRQMRGARHHLALRILDALAQDRAALLQMREIEIAPDDEGRRGDLLQALE